MPYKNERFARKYWVNWLRENYGVGGDGLSYVDCARYISEFTNQKLDVQKPTKEKCARFLSLAKYKCDSPMFRRLR